MLEPDKTAHCCAALRDAVDAINAVRSVAGTVPLTVKCRLGVDEHDSFDELREFVQVVAAVGVDHFIVHARKAILGLDTARNRSVPPLRHEWVFHLAAEFPHLRFSINGGITNLEQVTDLLRRGAYSAMIGRRARDEPYMFAGAGLLIGELAGPSRREVLQEYVKYAERAQTANWGEAKLETCARALLVPLAGLFHGTHSCTKWKQALTAKMQQKQLLLQQTVGSLITICLEESGVSAAVLDERPSAMIPRRVGPAVRGHTRVMGRVGLEGAADVECLGSGQPRKVGHPDGASAQHFAHSLSCQITSILFPLQSMCNVISHWARVVWVGTPSICPGGQFSRLFVCTIGAFVPVMCGAVWQTGVARGLPRLLA
mmetsp:Transcript_14221/g.31969  ORF Transcript_14221/g.31969 Transcript_14221/m.31969 type:complete len:372 (-) Transcript_14221:557-1672(-)